MNTALIVIDLQLGFAESSWGATNPGTRCRENCLALIGAFHASGRPVVIVRHDSTKLGSPLGPTHPGNALDPGVHPDEACLLVTKTVNSAFYGTPDLDTWLRDQGITTIVVCGIQTNMCVETTARMSGNLGYEVIVPIDATRTFDLTGPTIAGTTWSLTADELLRACAVSLHGGGFATVTTTADVLDRLSSRERRPVWTTGHTASTDVPVETHWETYVSMLSGDLVLPGGDRFEPEGPLAVGTRIAVTPAGQETISSEITVFDAPHLCTDRTRFGGVVLDFTHTFERDGAGTRIVHLLKITGDGGAEIGPQISADFPDQMEQLIRAAKRRSTAASAD